LSVASGCCANDFGSKLKGGGQEQTPKRRMQLLRGSLAEVISTIIDLLSNKGDWILQFEPDNSKKYRLGLNIALLELKNCAA